jgi:hypothetical protein
MIDEDVAHDARRNSEEVGASLPLHALAVDQPQVGFVDERCRLERVSCTLLRHLPARNPTQLRVDERRQAVQRIAVSLAPCQQMRRGRAMWFAHRQAL